MNITILPYQWSSHHLDTIVFDTLVQRKLTVNIFKTIPAMYPSPVSDDELGGVGWREGGRDCCVPPVEGRVVTKKFSFLHVTGRIIYLFRLPFLATSLIRVV